jgi:peroxiredoxin Q/BCP
VDNVNRIRVGFLAPDFALKDSGGRTIALSDYLGKRNVLLFFHQGTRCRFCCEWANELAGAYHLIRSKNTEIIGISPDDLWVTEKLKRENKIEFPILKDEKDTKGKSAAPKPSQQYGVQMSGVRGPHFHPAIFIIDKGGIIRFRKVCTHPTKKAEVEELLCELGKLS